MTKEQKFKKEYVFELLKIAHGDLETTQILLKASSAFNLAKSTYDWAMNICK